MTAKTRAKPKPAECAVPDCRSEPANRGLCAPHYDTHRGLAADEEGN